MHISDLEHRVLNYINIDEVISLLQGLVRIKSTSPPGNCVEAAKYCADVFRNEGIQYSIVANIPERPSVLATIPGKQKHPSLAFNAHLDTVPVENLDSWHYDPFGAIIQEGNLYGRGAGDDKSSVIAQVMAAIVIHRSGVKLCGDLIVNPVADEEDTGQHGTQWLREKGFLRPDMLIIGEQTNNQVAIAERSTHWMKLRLSGKSAHGATPWAGVNAILKMAGVLKHIESDFFLYLSKYQHPYLPPATMNIGTISGGLNTNIVPERCIVTIDCRLPPGVSIQSIILELEKLLESYSKNVDAIDYELNVIYSDNTPVNTKPEDPLVGIMQSAIEDINGKKREITGYQQSGDGRFFANDNIPIVIFGPSDPEVGHSADEFVPVSQVVEAAQVYTLTALRALRASWT